MVPLFCLYRPKVLRASAAGIATTDAIGIANSKVGNGGEDIGYKTFLVHLYDLLEEKISTDRYDEGVRQLVGNQVYENAQPRSFVSLNGNQLLRPIDIHVFGYLMLSCHAPGATERFVGERSVRFRLMPL